MKRVFIGAIGEDVEVLEVVGANGARKVLKVDVECGDLSRGVKVEIFAHEFLEGDVVEIVDVIFVGHG